MTRRFDTNEADEAESIRPLAFTVEPSRASTRTLQVMASEFCARLAAVFDQTSEALWSNLGNVEGVFEVGVLSM